MKIQGNEINPQELNNLNKEVLTTMIQSVHIQNPHYSAHNSSQTQPQYPPPQQQSYSSTHTDPNNMMNQINTPPIVKDSKEEIYNNQFQMRQNEYDNMLQRKTPAEIDFRETSNDENKDINELLERERKEREELMKPVLRSSNKINIERTNNNIVIETEELQEPKGKKSVSWNNEGNANNVAELLEVHKSEMYSMRLHIIDLTTKLEETNKRILQLESLVENTDKNEPSSHNVSKYANLEEKKEEAINPINTMESVLVETVESDSDSSK